MKRNFAVLAPSSLLSFFALAISTTDVRAELIGHWPLDGDGTAIVGTNGNLVGSPTATADRFGTPDGALSFDGSDFQRVEIPGGGGLNDLQEGTISMFVQWNGNQDGTFHSSNGNVTGRQRNGTFSNQILGLSSTDPDGGGVTWQAYSAGAPVMTGVTPVGSGVWRHVAVTYQSGDHTLYIDGNVDATGTANGTIGNNVGTPFAIGAWIGDGAGYSTSIIDDVKVFDRVLSEGEIQGLNPAVPEPSSIAMFGIGALGLFGYSRRRWQTSAAA